MHKGDNCTLRNTNALLRTALTNYWGFLAAVTLIAIKTYPLIAQSSIFAEDSYKHARTAIEMPWIHALLTPYMGYYSFLNNALIVPIVKLAPIQSWAILITCSTIGVICMVIATPYTGSSPIRSSALLKNTVALIIAVTCLQTDYHNMWRSTIHLQFFLPIASVIILFSNTKNKNAIIFRNTLIASAMLTGVTTAILTPFFILKAIWMRKTASIYYPSIRNTAIIATIATFIQGLYVLYMISQGYVNDRNQHSISIFFYLNYIANINILSLVIPKEILKNILTTNVAYVYPIIMILCASAIAYRYANKYEWAFLVVSLYVSSFYFLAAYNENYSQFLTPKNPNFRYSFTGVTLLSILVTITTLKALINAKNRNYAAYILLFALTVTAATNYHHIRYPYYGSSWYEQGKKYGHKKMHIYKINSAKRATFYYCATQLCNHSRMHDITDKVYNITSKTHRSVAWSYASNTITTPVMRSVNLQLPTITPDEKNVLRLAIDAPQKGRVRITCTQSSGTKIIKKYALKRHAQVLYIAWNFPSKKHADCNVAIKAGNGRYRINVKAYYDAEHP